MKKNVFLCVFIAIGMIFSACKGEEDDDASLCITSDQQGTTVFAGESIQLNAVLGSYKVSAEWTSSDDTVATVADGLVSGVQDGSVTVTAAADGKRDAVTILVTTRKRRPTAVGDIVFADGTAVAYNSKLNLSRALKLAAVGVVYSADGAVKAVSKRAPDKAGVYQRSAGSWDSDKSQYYHSREATSFVAGISGAWTLPAVSDVEKLGKNLGIVEAALAACEGRVLHYASDRRNLFWTSDCATQSLAEYDGSSDAGESYVVNVLTGAKLRTANTAQYSVLAVAPY